MELQTKIRFSEQSHNLVDYTSNILLFGSCFSDNIAEKLEYYKFQNEVNPFGILFHPIAIENLVTRAINQDHYAEGDLIHINERWHCFDAHSNISNSKKEELLLTLNNSLETTFKQLKLATHVVITLGTAWVYRHIETDKRVANCHKVPQKKFLKGLLSVDEIVESLEAIITLIRALNNTVSFVFTISPVRHIKDGIIENNRSKSHLISAIHQLVDIRKQLYYFPSYEILMDELRDYRFYKEDMIHPSHLAIDYVWDKFSEIWINSDAKDVMSDVEEIQKGLQHKPFNSESEQHQAFLTRLNNKIEVLIKQYPHMQF